MMRIRLALTSVMAAALLAACGGGGDGNQAPAVQYTQLVSFGDSLSDVGTYGTDGMKAGAASAYAGKYTVNGPNAKNWTELLAAQLRLSAPCPAETGLLSISSLSGLAQAVVDHAGCYNYAQGGARVTDAVGPGNLGLLALTPAETAGALGQMTVPVVTQISRHLAAVGGAFSGNELVTVMAGGNDVFRLLADVSYGRKTTTEAVTAMGVAGGQLAAYVNTLIVAKGAKRVVVANLVDVSKSPFGYSQSASTQAFINVMVATFNAQLSAGLASTQGVLLVDAYTASRDQAANPGQYGLSNATTPACNLSAATNPLASSMMCNDGNVISGDVSTYLFADTVHPTPFGYKLLTQLITGAMAARGWL
ncbi:MAG: SGNH/GDSL hydrolase family protein [Burkholderiales bacterium]|nr:SGNH/GDSL hydrolase family protein [Burkholderiales bacterium]